MNEPVLSPLSSADAPVGHTASPGPNLAALDAALHKLRLGDFQTRWEAAKAIPPFGIAAIEPLLTLLQEEDSDWELLWFVARILGNLTDPSAVDALVNLLQTTDNVEVAGMAATALANQGEIAIASLSRLLQAESTRLLAVQALAQIRHPEVVPPLLAMVSDPSPMVRAAAIEALSHFYNAAISSVLLAALEDLHPSVRKAAVIGLGIQAEQFDKTELVNHLKQRLWDFNGEVCSQAAIALGRIGTNEAADALSELLQSPHTPLPLQTEAIRALARIETVHALEQFHQWHHRLKHRLEREQDVESQHPRTSENQEHQVPYALTALSSDLEVQREMIAVLGRVESPEAKAKAVEILLDLLNEKHPLTQDLRSKQAIALALGQLEQPQALDALIQLLADTNASVQFHAIAALKQLDAEAAYQQLQTLAKRDDLSAALKQGVAIALQEWGI